ncbi:hypothetical protein [Pseudoflavonifractor sp. 60]|uniref:hypothetical protein n=1 Tax=Pseudoflavonifractor sp. 60 TaxID=2304576 RepID=UPI00136C894C|nr:hypothetical protein [Pseudoflavonifractor sp. 60]
MMTQKIKTGLCILALLLALLAAYRQESAIRQSAAPGTLVQPAPFSALVPAR